VSALEAGAEDLVRGRDVLELGSGVALGAVAAGKLGARSVLATDGAPATVEIAQLNLKENLVVKAGGLEAMGANVLRWGEAEGVAAALARLQTLGRGSQAEAQAATGYGLVVGADCLYNLDAIDALAKTWDQVSKGARGGKATLLMTMQTRVEGAEEAFEAALLKHGGHRLRILPLSGEECVAMIDRTAAAKAAGGGSAGGGEGEGHGGVALQANLRMRCTQFEEYYKVLRVDRVDTEQQQEL